jgi:hypothetical protein
MFRICLSPKILALLALYAAIEKRKRERSNFLGYFFCKNWALFIEAPSFIARDWSRAGEVLQVLLVQLERTTVGLEVRCYIK